VTRLYKLENDLFPMLSLKQHTVFTISKETQEWTQRQLAAIAELVSQSFEEPARLLASFQQFAV